MKASILARATLNFLLYLNSPLVYKVSIVHHLLYSNYLHLGDKTWRYFKSGNIIERSLYFLRDWV